MLREQDGVVLAGGQGRLEGKIIRIGHMGYFTFAYLLETMIRVELRLQHCGFETGTAWKEKGMQPW